MLSKPEYLGDGVYIQHINGMVTLTTGRHMPTNENPGSQPDNTVYMEPSILVGMLRWLTRNDPAMQRFLAVCAEGNSSDDPIVDDAVGFLKQFGAGGWTITED